MVSADGQVRLVAQTPEFTASQPWRRAPQMCRFSKFRRVMAISRWLQFGRQFSLRFPLRLANVMRQCLSFRAIKRRVKGLPVYFLLVAGTVFLGTTLRSGLERPFA